MLPATKCLSANEILGHIEEVWHVLRRKGFSEHVIDAAVTAVYLAVVPYATGARKCSIMNLRAWVFRVAIRTAKRAAVRELRCEMLEPAVLSTMATVPGNADELFDVWDVLTQLTKPQSTAVQLCILNETSLRDAAKIMGIAVGTLCRHLDAGKKRLEAVLAQKAPEAILNYLRPGAGAGANTTYMVSTRMRC